MARVCWSDKGEESVLGIGRYIIEQTQSRQRGIDVITKIEEKCNRYAEFPLMGTSRDDIGPGLRCFPVDSFLIIYRPIQDGIVVVLVAHGHQDLRTIVEKIFGNSSDD